MTFSPSASSRITRPPTCAGQRRARRSARPRGRGAGRADHLPARSCSTRRTSASRRQCERFDLAEPIPGPDDRRDAGAGAASSAVVLIVPIFERQARGRLPQLGGDHRRRRLAARRVSQDAHPGRSALQREVLLHAGRRVDQRRRRRAAGQASGFRVWKTRYANIGVLICWDQWYPGGGAHHQPARRRHAVLSDGDRLASRRRRTSGARRRSTRGARSSARTRSPTASSSRRRIASATRTSRAPTASSSSATRSSPIRSAASSPRRAPSRRFSIAKCDPALIEDTRRNWPFLRDRRIDAYAPILSRYLGA